MKFRNKINEIINTCDVNDIWRIKKQTTKKSKNTLVILIQNHMFTAGLITSL